MLHVLYQLQFGIILKITVVVVVATAEVTAVLTITQVGMRRG